MNVKYLRNRATAERLIRNNGAKFPWRKVEQGAFDPVTEEAVETVTPQTVWAVILPPGGDPFSSKVDQYKGENGVLDLSKVRKIIVSTQALEYNPEPLHQIFYKGEWWTYENNTDLAPDGVTDILFKGLIRRT